MGRLSQARLTRFFGWVAARGAALQPMTRVALGLVLFLVGVALFVASLAIFFL